MSILTGGHTGSGSASNNPWAAPNANSASSLTWYYYHETKTFASGPKLMVGRRYHGSATIVDQGPDHVISTGPWNLNFETDNMLIRSNPESLILNVQFFPHVFLLFFTR